MNPRKLTKNAATIPDFQCEPVAGKYPLEAGRALSLTFGVFSEQSEAPNTTEQLVSRSLESLVARAAIEADDLVAIIGGTPGQSETTNFVEINTASSCLGKKG